jgi:hypothetical protein
MAGWVIEVYALQKTTPTSGRFNTLLSTYWFSCGSLPSVVMRGVTSPPSFVLPTTAFFRRVAADFDASMLVQVFTEGNAWDYFDRSSSIKLRYSIRSHRFVPIQLMVSRHIYFLCWRRRCADSLQH